MYVGVRRGARDPFRRIRCAVLLAVILLIASACARTSTGHPANSEHRTTSAAATSPADGSTVSRTFTPFDATGELTVPVSRTVTGHCWTSSVAAPGSRAYRCLAGTATILDPCYAGPAVRPTSVACFADPWSDAVVLRIAQLLPASGGNGPPRAWAMELVGGVRCVTSTGTVPMVAGQNLPYRCTDGSAATVPAAASAVVVARYARSGATDLRGCRVLTLWRG